MGMLPILILGFIRVDTLKRTIESVLAQEHGPIYISCDAPPSDYLKQGSEVQMYLDSLLDSGKVREVRISDSHQGLLKGVTSGVSWFFERVERGVILEDDLVIQAGLLKSVELASEFLNDQRVVSIGLHNAVPANFIASRSEVLRGSRFVISWGWVTTKEQWNSRIKTYGEVDYFRLAFKMIPVIGISSTLYHLIHYKKRVRQEETNVRGCGWADLWQINAFTKDLTTLTYNKNFVDYIGYGNLSTHTHHKNLDYPLEKVTEHEMDVDNFNPVIESTDKRADRYFTRNRRLSTIFKRVLRIRTRFDLRKDF
jgi:hypothetical protein